MALNKYIMSLFIDDLASRFNDKYIFKGGNLLWYYIKTPRPTVDIDFATDTHIEYDSVVKDFCSVQIDTVTLTLLKQERVSKTDKEAIKFRIGFETDSGASNSFGIDIVLAISTHKKLVKIIKTEATSASIENIIIDKLSAIHKFQGRNTRIKDFDDLYRIALSKIKVNSAILDQISKDRSIPLQILKTVSGESMQSSWKEYISRRDYKGSKDLPESSIQLIETINKFLSML